MISVYDDLLFIHASPKQHRRINARTKVRDSTCLTSIWCLLKSKRGKHMGVEFVGDFCSCAERWNFLHSHTPTPGFLSPQKAHFQIPIPPGREEKDALFVCTTTTKALFIFTNQHCLKSAKERSLSMDLESGVTFPNVTSVKRYPNHCPFKMEKNPLENFKDGLQPLVSKYRMTQEIHPI